MGYSDVVTLLPLMAATPADYGPGKLSLTTVGNAAVSTAQSKFYGSSWLFGGSGDYLSMSSSRFELSAGFEMECWVRLTDLSAVRVLIFIGTIGSDNSRIQLYVNTDGSVSLFGNTSAGATVFWATTATGVVTAGTWFHILGWRNGNDVGVAIDGAQVATATASGTVGTATGCHIGYGRTSGAHRYMYGHVNDVQVIAGDAVRTGTFTPPTRLVGQIAGTVTDNSVPVARKIFAVPREYASRTWMTTSSSEDGSYSLWVPSGIDVSRVVCADDTLPLRNDVVDRIVAA